MRLSRWRNPTFRTRWSVSSDSVLRDRTPRETKMPVRFSTRCPNSDYLGFEASPEAIVAAAKKAEEVGFDAIFVNDHIHILLTALRAQHRGPTFGIRSLRCRSLQRTRCLGSGLWRRAAQGCRLSRFSGANPIQGYPWALWSALSRKKGFQSRPAPIRPMEEGGV